MELAGILEHCLWVVVIFLPAYSKAAPASNPLATDVDFNIQFLAGYCQVTTYWDITSYSKPYFQTPQLFSGVEVGPDPAGGSLTAGESYTKGASWSFSGSVTFPTESIAKALTGINPNFGASYSVSWSESTSISGSQACPPNVVCGLTASALLVDVDGQFHTEYSSWCEEKNTQVPYKATFPMTQNNGPQGASRLVTDFRACVFGKTVQGLDQCPDSAVPVGVPAPSSKNPQPPVTTSSSKPPAPNPSSPAACNITGNDVNYRTCPKTTCSALGQYPINVLVAFACRTTGESVDGNDYWDKNPEGNYVSENYVDAKCASALPPCAT